jgi:hypothetical protein
MALPRSLRQSYRHKDHPYLNLPFMLGDWQPPFDLGAVVVGLTFSQFSRKTGPPDLPVKCIRSCSQDIRTGVLILTFRQKLIGPLHDSPGLGERLVNYKLARNKPSFDRAFVVFLTVPTIA